MKATAIVLLGLLPAVGICQPASIETVLTEKRALVVFPAELIVGQQVIRFEISPAGRYVVAAMMSPGVERLGFDPLIQGEISFQIVVWDSQDRTTNSMHLDPGVRIESVSFDWFAGVDRVLVSAISEYAPPDPEDLSIQEDAVLGSDHYARILDLKTSRALQMQVTQGWFGQGSAMLSPTRPYGVLVSTKPRRLEGNKYAETVSFRKLNADGSMGTQVVLPYGYVSVGDCAWTSDGERLLVVATHLLSEGSREQHVVEFDPATGAWQVVPRPTQTFASIAPKPDVLLLADQVSNKSEARTWRLRSTSPTKRPEAVVAEHADEALLSPNDDFVAFTYKGALFVSRINRYTLEQYEQLMLEATKVKTMSDAKQCVLAFLMFAADNDDTIPPGLSITTDLMPYANNLELLSQFVYTFPGGKYTDIADPAGTQIGYIATQYGRAVAFADGHVEWRDD